MQKINYFLFFTIISFLLANLAIKAEDNVGKVFGRYMEYAQPSPNNSESYKMESVIIIQSNNPSYFFNANTTVDEDAYQSKMQNESSIAINPLNPLNMVASAVDYRGFDSWVYVSDDGGKTWRNINLGKPENTESSAGNDPSVCFDNEGRAYMCYGAFGPRNGDGSGENGVYVARSTNGGVNWTSHLTVIEHIDEITLDTYFEDKYYIHVDNAVNSPYESHLYIPWKRVTPRDSATQIVFSKSADFGDTWTTPINISNREAGSSEDTTFGQSFPLIRTGPNGEVYCVWNHGIVHGVGFARSEDGGDTWTPAEIIHNYNIFGETTLINGQGYRHTVKGTVRAEAYPSMEVDITGGDKNGNIYLCWAADNYPNIYFSRSEDKGETWTEPIIVHSDTTNDQFWPWLAIDRTNGDIAIMYLDSRDDADNIITECYVSYSSDGGDSWQDLRASDVGFDLRLNPFGSVTGRFGGVFAGDYNGCAFHDGVIYPSWVDMRPSVDDVRDSDVYTAIINTRAPKPVEQLVSQFFVEDPRKIELTWIDPETYVLGQEMPDEEYEVLLYRDGELIQTFPGASPGTYSDDVEPFQEYDYEVYVVARGDTSAPKFTSSYAGGSDIPAPPVYINHTNNINSMNYLYDYTNLEVKLPEFRDDGVTPITFLDSLMVNIYNFKNELVLTDSYDISDVDFSNNILIELDHDEQLEIGWYRYEFYVMQDWGDGLVTNSDIGFELDIPVGTIDFENSPPELETYNGEFEYPFFYSENWDLTNELFNSSPTSLTESPNADYEPVQFDTLISRNFLINKLTPGNESQFLEISFFTAAAVHPQDSAILEFSDDAGKTWYMIDNYNYDQFEEWEDGELNSSDWKFMRYVIDFDKLAEIINFKPTDAFGNMNCFVRFRFKSNTIINRDGWFIDDLLISYRSATSVNDKIIDNIKLYPNPANNFINVNFDENIKTITKIEIIDLYGSVQKIATNYINNTSIDVSDLASGIYIINLYSNEEVIGSQKINIIK